MNPRVDFNSRDAAALVDLVTRYKSLSTQQVLLYFSSGSERIQDLMRYFSKSGRLCFSRDHTHIACNEDWASTGNAEVEAAFWALLDFTDKIDVHYPGTDGVTITAYDGQDEYDFVTVMPGKEAAISAQINVQRAALSDRLVVVLQSFEQIPRIAIEQASAYCVVAKDGKTTYYTTPKELCPHEQNTIQSSVE